MRTPSNLVFLSSHDLYWRTTATVDSCTCKLQTARAPTSTRANGEQKHRAQQSFSFLRLDCNGGTPLPLSSPPLPSWPLRKVQHVGLVPNQRVPHYPMSVLNFTAIPPFCVAPFTCVRRFVTCFLFLIQLTVGSPPASTEGLLEEVR